MSIRLVSRLAGARPRQGLKTWALILLLLHAACATRGPVDVRQTRTVTQVEDPPTQESVHLRLSSRVGAVQVSELEFQEAMSALVLKTPLRLASLHFPLYLHRRLAVASAPLTGEAWHTSLSQSYGRFCEWQGTPGDCLELFKDGPGLDDKDKRDIALALSVSTALEARDAELRSMFSTTQLWTTLSCTLTGYMALLVAPEPISKGVAAALTVLMWGYLGWEFFDLIRAYFQLWEEAAEASTFAELREAGLRFGKVIGPNSMRIMLMLGTAAVGETAALISKAPSLPGFTNAAGTLESRDGISDVLAAMQEADKVKAAVDEGTFGVILPANVLSMAARGPLTSGDSPKKLEIHHIATVENEKSTARGGPWTQRFKEIFDEAGLSMEDQSNKVALEEHKGPHPQEYHELVYERLSDATKDCPSTLECRNALIAELRRLARQLTDKSSTIYKALTQSAPH